MFKFLFIYKNKLDATYIRIVKKIIQIFVLKLIQTSIKFKSIQISDEKKMLSQSTQAQQVNTKKTKKIKK